MFGNALPSSALMSPSKSGQSCISVLISSCFSTNRCSLMTSVPLFQATNTPVLVTMLVVLPKFMCWLPPKAHKAMVRFSAFEPSLGFWLSGCCPFIVWGHPILCLWLASWSSLKCVSNCVRNVQFFGFLFIFSSCACTCTPNTMFHSHSAQDLQS